MKDKNYTGRKKFNEIGGNFPLEMIIERLDQNMFFKLGLL